MPDSSTVLGIGSGLARGLANVFYGKRQQDMATKSRQEDRNAQLQISLLPEVLKRAASYDDVQPYIDRIMGNEKGTKVKAGETDHHAILSHLLGPLFKENTTTAPTENVPTTGATGTLTSQGPMLGPPATDGELPSSTFAQPTTTQPKPRQTLMGVPVLSPEEMQARESAGIESEETAKMTAQYKVKIKQVALLQQLDPTMSTDDALIAVGLKVPKDSFGVVPTGGGVFNKATGQIVSDPTGSRHLPTGEAGKYVGLALMKQGVVPEGDMVSADQLTKALPLANQLAEADAKDKKTSADTLIALRQLQEQNLTGQMADLPTDADLQQSARSITVNGKTYSFVSKGDYTGARAQNAAQKAGTKAGVLVVSPQEAAQLGAAQATLLNLDAFFQQIKEKLPPDAAGRPLASLSNKLAQVFQTDDELGAFVSWDLEVVPMLRSLLVNNRITNVEFTKALNARPKITDTVGVAAQKMDNLETIIANSVKPILERGGGKKATGAAATPSTLKVGQKVTVKGKEYTVGVVHPDGSWDPK